MALTLPTSLNPSLFTSATSAVSALTQGATDKAQAQSAAEQAAAAQTTASADLLQGQGDVIEGQAYGEAASLAELNAQYTKTATNVAVAQGQQQIYQTIGGVKASAGSAGLTTGGTAGDILRMSASQGALNQDITLSQGQINVAGYNEQAQSYQAMQSAAMLASQEQTLASQGEQDVSQGYQDVSQGYETAASYSDIGAIISGAGAVASLFMPAGGGGLPLTGPGGVFTNLFSS
jgi:hypothetical protein